MFNSQSYGEDLNSEYTEKLKRKGAKKDCFKSMCDLVTAPETEVKVHVLV